MRKTEGRIYPPPFHFRNNMMIYEHDRVILKNDLSEYRLKAGDIGIVVHIYADGEAYEVEFFAVDGRTLDVITLSSADVRPVTERDVLHARIAE
jgi:ATP-dependent exoDNAse (exonuclease V) alpha subunit